jgi:hypothetical protein
MRWRLPTGSDSTYADISGSFGGPMNGSSQGYTLNTTLTLTITQSGASVSGTYGTSGTLTFGGQGTQIAGTGAFTGTVAAGNNPSVNITLTIPGCPNYSAHWSGAYDSANHRLTITGPVDIFNANSCTVGLSFQGTIILSK